MHNKEGSLTTGGVKNGNIHVLSVVMHVNFSSVQLLKALLHSNKPAPGFP